jgi:NAD(P)-dependent dehydrogenase (short-subunit alcohol dehydrogenase family)
MDLKDKRALITGGTSGMGSAAALAMAEKGASVITGRDEARRAVLRGRGFVLQIRTAIFFFRRVAGGLRLGTMCSARSGSR